VSGVRDTAVFNRTDRAVEGWYWAIRSEDLPVGAVRKVRLVGRDLVVWRAADGAVSTFDAYCPHMGAHLGEGKVDGDSLRCFFHAWQFDKRGVVRSIPCQDHPISAAVASWPTEEAYGLVWVWTGPTPRHPVPFIPALRDRPIRARLGGAFEKGCHPNVVMVNAIDEQHFASVHNLFVDLHFDVAALNENAATWDNTTRVPDSSWFTRFIGRFYSGPLTYRMTYWNGTTGSVTVGPDFWHFHIVFALRPTDAGHTEGQTILVSPALPSLPGRIWNEIALSASKVVGDYFAKGDTEVFKSIRWDFKHPLRADRSIVSFIQHLDGQPAVRWGTWEPVGADS
jgi:phenylpropionate dioxygenase-like ring-hydroxylating dioxygenase large terminal subunit